MTVFVNLFDIIGLVFLLLLIAVAGVIMLSVKIKQYFCKHERYYEDMSCNAICRDCSKDLGFIGDVRKNET